MLKKRQWIYTLLLSILVIIMMGCSSNSQDSKNDQDILSKTSWISDTDYSQIIFNEDKSFEWYQSKEEKDDNYYAGTYTFYIGQEAMDHVTDNLSEYGVGKEEMEEIFAGDEEFELNNFVILTLNNESFIIEGKEQLSQPGETYFFGFLLEQGSVLDVANMDSGVYAWFEKE